MDTLIGGLVIGGAVIWLALRLRGRDIEVKWYEWLIVATGLVLLFFTVQNFAASFTELQPTAAWMFLLIMGLPAVILLAVAGTLVWRRQRAAG